MAASGGHIEYSVGRDPPSLPRLRRQHVSKPLASHQGLVACLTPILPPPSGWCAGRGGVGLALPPCKRGVVAGRSVASLGGGVQVPRCPAFSPSPRRSGSVLDVPRDPRSSPDHRRGRVELLLVWMQGQATLRRSSALIARAETTLRRAQGATERAEATRCSLLDQHGGHTERLER